MPRVIAMVGATLARAVQAATTKEAKAGADAESTAPAATKPHPARGRHAEATHARTQLAITANPLRSRRTSCPSAASTSTYDPTRSRTSIAAGQAHAKYPDARTRDRKMHDRRATATSAAAASTTWRSASAAPKRQEGDERAGCAGSADRDGELRRGEARSPGTTRPPGRRTGAATSSMPGSSVRDRRRGDRIRRGAASRTPASSTTTRRGSASRTSARRRKKRARELGAHRPPRGECPQHRRGGTPAADREPQRGDRAAARPDRGARQPAASRSRSASATSTSTSIRA